MWPLFRKKPKAVTDLPDLERLFENFDPNQAVPAPPKRKPLSFEKLLDGMGDLSELGSHDSALKFWLPDPAEKALEEFADLQGASMSSMLREFLAAHCYGIYAVQILRVRDPDVFDEPVIRFSRAYDSDEERKVRKTTYWVPELGKNVAPVKIWVAQRLRDDLQALAEHVKIPLSQYVREIVISRLLGHGMLPKRPEMLEAAPLPSADDWCEDKEVPWVEVDEETYWKSPDGRKETEWED